MEPDDEALARRIPLANGLLEQLAAIEPELFRYPAVDPLAFRGRVQAFADELNDRAAPLEI